MSGSEAHPHAIRAGGAGAPGHTHDPVHSMAQHVLMRLGIHVHDDDLLRFDLRLAPEHLDPDGHVNFGVLGTYVDMASSQPEGMQLGRPFVHADITVHRLARPRGGVLSADARAPRLGKRSGVVEIDVHDDAGVHVARSVQEVVFPGAAPVGGPPDRDGSRERFYSQFQTDCSLGAPFPEVLRISGPHGGDAERWWEIPLDDASRNGFGGLHGGVTTALLDVAAVGLVAAEHGGAPRTVSAAVRYLAPTVEHPVRAVPRVVAAADGVAVVVVEVRAADGRLTILADLHVALRPEG